MVNRTLAVVSLLLVSGPVLAQEFPDMTKMSQPVDLSKLPIPLDQSKEKQLQGNPPIRQHLPASQTIKKVAPQ